MAEIYPFDKVSTSYLELKELGRVKLFRRRGLKNIRISIDSAGEIRLSVPWYIPKVAGIRYLYTKKDWIKENRKTVRTEWEDGLALTRDYTLKLSSYKGKLVKSSIQEKTFQIYVPGHLSGVKRQQLIDKHVKKFLQSQAESILIPLTSEIAHKSGYSFKSIRIRSLRSRWGSCNHKKIITLNQSLINLPDELAEYVVFHELVHTKHLNHSKRFWSELETKVPDYKQRRKQLKSYNIAGNF